MSAPAGKVIDLMGALKKSLAQHSDGLPDLLTVDEVAARLKVHPKTVTRLPIPYTNVGTRKKQIRRYHPDDVEAWRLGNTK